MLARFALFFPFLTLLLTGPVLSADPPPIPGFTAGARLERTAPHDWNLGPTGARGWVYAWKGESTASRRILITEIAEGSPADGVLAKDDVILGLNGQPFESDARIEGKTSSEVIDNRVTVAISPDSAIPQARRKCDQHRRVLLSNRYYHDRM